MTRWDNIIEEVSRADMICSKCGHKIDVADKSNFCPKCGATMLNESEEEE